MNIEEQIEAIDDIEKSEGYKLIIGRIKDKLSAIRGELECSSTTDNDMYLKGQVAAIKDVLGLPDYIKKELRGDLS